MPGTNPDSVSQQINVALKTALAEFAASQQTLVNAQHQALSLMLEKLRGGSIFKSGSFAENIGSYVQNYFTPSSPLNSMALTTLVLPLQEARSIRLSGEIVDFVENAQIGTISNVGPDTLNFMAAVSADSQTASVPPDQFFFLPSRYSPCLTDVVDPAGVVTPPSPGYEQYIWTASLDAEIPVHGNRFLHVAANQFSSPSNAFFDVFFEPYNLKEFYFQLIK